MITRGVALRHALPRTACVDPALLARHAARPPMRRPSPSPLGGCAAGLGPVLGGGAEELDELLVQKMDLASRDGEASET